MNFLKKISKTFLHSKKLFFDQIIAFLYQIQVRINKKMVGICINKGAKKSQNLLVWPFLGSFGRFWAFLAITWDLQMLESWFWCQTSCFGMKVLKKISKTFFALKKFIF